MFWETSSFENPGLHFNRRESNSSVFTLSLFSFVLIITFSICFTYLKTSPWAQGVNWRYIRRSKDFLDVSWTFYGSSIYVLLLEGAVNHRTQFSTICKALNWESIFIFFNVPWLYERLRRNTCQNQLYKTTGCWVGIFHL